MRGFLLFVVVILSHHLSFAQRFSAKDFLFAASYTDKKFDNFISRNFSLAGKVINGDTVITTYNLRSKKKNDDDSVVRRFETYLANDHLSFAFFTSSLKEYADNKRFLYEDGFFCGLDNDTIASALFQKRNIAVTVTRKETDDTVYSFLFQQVELPTPDKIRYADDLLQFISHESLVSVFGEKNVIKDIYYLSEKEIAKCSILFPRTSRQAVFFWEDEINLRKPATIIISGHMNTGNSANYNGLINENVWKTKDGVYSGMSLNSLIELNGNTFKFYGKNSSSPFMILADNVGAIDFKTNVVVLGCLNPNGSSELEQTTVDAGKILNDNLGLFVFMMILYPPVEETTQTGLSKK